MAITTLFEKRQGKDMLTAALHRRYGGPLSFPPAQKGRPYIVSNFVSTLDGVVSYAIPGKSGGGEISGFNEDDRFVMGLLRALSDAVVMGSGTLNSGSGDAFIPSMVCPSFKKEFAVLRRRLGKSVQPLNVFLSASGTIDLAKPVFHYPGLKTIVITTEQGARKLQKDHGERLRVTNIVSVGKGNTLEPQRIAGVLFRDHKVRLLLHEGGPTVFGQFIRAGLVDEMFLTLAPQVAGQTRRRPRLSFAAEVSFTPDAAPWYRIKSTKVAGDHLFLRYVPR